MMAIGAVLALLMGVVLGLLGGGGSILAVPILVYVFGLAAKPAIATSLLVVGTTSLVAMLQHARQGNVLWKKGLLFGAFAMLGAFGGGRIAVFLPGGLLLALFSGMMVATAVAMLRASDRPDCPGEVGTPPAPPQAIWKIAAEGLVVGTFTGLVGAGGGFLVVPALVLFGGIPMHAAVGTSLLIIALKSFAGLAGYLSHVSVDPTIAGVVTAAAVLGSIAGAGLSSRIRPEILRRAFAWFVLAMGLGMLSQQIDLGAFLQTSGLVFPMIGGALVGFSAFVLHRRSGRNRAI